MRSMKSVVCWFVLCVAAIPFMALAGTLAPDTQVTDSQIRAATCSLYVRQVLGWRYKTSESPVWEKGSKEAGSPGQVGGPDSSKNVRAIALGTEGEYVVFMTLRSFVDPTFPNPFMQGLDQIPQTRDGASIPMLNRGDDGVAESDIRDQLREKQSDPRPINSEIVRYGQLKLTWYEDMGGGVVKIKAQAYGVTHAETGPPRCNGGPVLRKPRDTINGVVYEKPHELVTAENHLEMGQLLATRRVQIKVFANHDVAFLYVPMSCFSERVCPPTLGLKDPTISGNLMFDHNLEIFGFRFSLMGDETLRMIQSYVPPRKDAADWQGTSKILNLAALALSPETLRVLRTVDSKINELIPDKLAQTRTRKQFVDVIWKEGRVMAAQIISNPVVVDALRQRLMQSIQGGLTKM